MTHRPLSLILLMCIVGTTGYFSYKLYRTYYGSFGSFHQRVYKSYFDHIGDLQVGHLVKVHGLSVGRVTDVRLSPDQRGVSVSFVLEKNIVVYDDVELAIEQGLLMGDPCISLKPGSSEKALGAETVIENTHSPLQVGSLVQKFLSGSSAPKKDISSDIRPISPASTSST